MLWNVIYDDRYANNCKFISSPHKHITVSFIYHFKNIYLSRYVSIYLYRQISQCLAFYVFIILNSINECLAIFFFILIYAEGEECIIWKAIYLSRNHLIFKFMCLFFVCNIGSLCMRLYTWSKPNRVYFKSC